MLGGTRAEGFLQVGNDPGFADPGFAVNYPGNRVGTGKVLGRERLIGQAQQVAFGDYRRLTLIGFAL